MEKKKEKINPPIPHDISNISITNIDTKENKNLDTTDNKTESSSKNECIICYINPKQITFAPCGHKCICKECYQKYKDTNKLNTCYICKRKIESVIDKVYDV